MDTKEELRAEVENPNGRFLTQFVYPGILVGAGIGLYFSGTAAIAEALGMRSPAPDTFQNIVINLLALVGSGSLWYRGKQDEERRLRRIQKGSVLAALRVTFLDASMGARGFKLSDLRQGSSGSRQSRRVIIVCAEEAQLTESLAEASKVSAELVGADFLVVPLVASSLDSFREPPPSITQGDAVAHIGMPLGIQSWGEFLKAEMETAVSQDPNALSRGFYIVVKKNGRVGTRRFGLPGWSGVIGEVDARKSVGFDTTNI
eukprot:CAMPEP_0169207612 /NCGR_PEP_ID=MMETSP1016-20121227/13686_1 /TAXON_ID=342587 /ORGANISM="Karlodinium micrum, Strain CCMP2283" /LENGTH=259 /DNA_ID=CAMNT_0009284921 /DNA_START=225 /DNA_END=1004 /DNA_ORIENTATION=-